MIHLRETFASELLTTQCNEQADSCRIIIALAKGSGYRSGFVFGSCPVRILARRLFALTDVLVLSLVPSYK